MTIDAALRITNKLRSGGVVTVRPDELRGYKELNSRAMEWAKHHRPKKYYDLVREYIMAEMRNKDDVPKCCETCYHWDQFSGVCCCRDGVYAGYFTDSDDLCATWKRRSLGNE